MPITESAIALLVPDLPDADELLPWLRRIDAARWYTNGGPLLRELESLLQQQWPAPGAPGSAPGLDVVALNNGTTALELAIMAMALPRGASVLMPSFTFPATASAALRGGLQPVFADVSHDTWQLTPANARAIAARQPLALVMPVATFGCPVDVDDWDAFSNDTGIAVLVDAAGAFGQQPVGRLTHLAFSLHATKPFGIGEGGLIATRDGALAERVRQLANFGFSAGRVEAWGSNGKLSEYAAAVALAQWQRWPALQAGRRAQWRHYLPLLKPLPGGDLQQGFDGSDDGAPLPANVIVQLPNPAAPIKAALAVAGIETRAWYCPPLHQQPAFSDCALASMDASGALANTERLASHSLGLPWHTRLSEADMARVTSTLGNILATPA